MSNRVEDLEKQVAELQAAVNGLTEELVETKERVRQLEDANDDGVVRGAQPAAAPETTSPAAEGGEAASDRGPTEQTTKSDVHADVVETEPADGTGDADVAAASNGDAAAADEGGDDLLIAGEDEVPPESKPDTPKGEGAKGQDDDGESEDSDIIVA